MAMGTGASGGSLRGSRGGNGRGAGAAKARRFRLQRIELEGLEARTLLSTLPAASTNGAIQNLTNLGRVTTGGNAVSPTVAIDPNNPNDMVSVWALDISTLSPVPHTTTVLEGKFSTDGGNTWTPFDPVNPILDAATIDSTPPTAYTQVTDPSVAFDAKGNFYVSALQTSGATDGAITLTEFQLTGGFKPLIQPYAPTVVYQWLTTSDAAYSPTLAVDSSTANPVYTGANDPYSGNIYVAWASGDIHPANPNVDTPFNPNRIEMVVSSDGGNSFSGPSILNSGGNVGNQKDSHPQILINQVGTAFTGTLASGSAVVTGVTASGFKVGEDVSGVGIPAGTTITFLGGTTLTLSQAATASTTGASQALVAGLGTVTAGWEDFGSGPAGGSNTTYITTNNVQPGQSFPFSNLTGGLIQPGTAGTGSADNPISTSFPISVSGFNAATIAALSNLTVSLSITHPTLSDISVVLQAPNGGPSITLFLNSTNGAGTNSTGFGLSGANLGIFGQSTTNPGITFSQGDNNVATIFTDTATRNIFDATTTGTNGNAAPYIGYFRPEVGSLDVFLKSVVSAYQANSTGQPFNGTWNLIVTDFRTETTPGFLNGVSLQFNTNMAVGTPNAISTGLAVPGSISDNYPTAIPAAPATGAGPGLVMAIDNTFGPNITSTGVSRGTEFQGRIYAAFVGYLPLEYPPGTKNPTSNTDIYMMYSDNGGTSWQFANGGNPVNNDNAVNDGFSQANENIDPASPTGRTQFMPAIAVDPTTGTVVMSWRDARYDVANTRVVTEIATSIDGGQSFSPQTYANPSQTAVDAITGNTIVMSPMGDNQGSANGQADGNYNYGTQMGLAAYGGQIYPIWAGNLNQSHITSGAVKGNPLNIFYQPMTIGAGPRIVNSTMGPIPLAEAQSGVVTFSVTFDRPVDPTTFVPGDVQVLYHDANNGTSFIPLFVSGVAPITSSGVGPTNTLGNSAYGYTQFTITFNPTLAANGTTPSGITNFTGTYSYLIAPDNGAGLAIASPVWTTANGVVTRQGDPMDQNANGTVDENAVTTAFTGLTPGDVYADPAPNPTTPVTFNGATSILTPPFNQNTLPLIVPGPYVAGSQAVGTSGQRSTSGDNLLLNDTSSLFNVLFDRPIQASTFTGDQTSTITIMGPAGTVTGPQSFASTSFGQTIPSATATGPGVLTVPLSVPSSNNTFLIEQLSVAFSLAMTDNTQLSMSLISPTGQIIPLLSGLTGSNFTNTILLDNPANEPPSISGGTAPFTGTYMPAYPVGNTQTLAGLKGQSADGTWYLQISNASKSLTGTLDNWSLNITPEIQVVPVAPANGLTNSFNILFPQQSLSGTYTINFGPNALQANGTLGPILDQFGNAIDTTQVAGLDVLRGQGTNAPVTTVQYGAPGLPQTIPAQTGATPGQIVSTISVPDNFVVQGDTTSSGVAGLQVQLNASFANDPNLSATLYYNYGKTGQIAVPLFSNVGSGTQTANFNNTIFNDNAATPVQAGSAPFFSTFTPQMPLSAFAGVNAMGNWTLVLQNNATSLTGTLNGWSLIFQKPLPTSGMGVPGQDAVGVSFRLFTMSPSNALSSQSWTAVGAAAIGSSSQTGGINGGAESSGAGGAGRVTGLAIDTSDPSGNTVYAAGASGGVWKTTNFLAPGGPTWVPLTDFGPTTSLNIGSIAVFPRNHNPNQTVIIAATGEGNTGTPGVGFLISTDGGQTWTLSDSTVNVDANGNPLPINSTARNRIFVGTTAFKVVVDPQPTPSGNVIIYAALSGNNGGIWRSEDTGKTWTKMLAGNATDVVLDPNSGITLDPATNTEVQGNLQVVYAALVGSGGGVYMSPNQGQVWNQMLGGVGNPLIYDGYNFTRGNVNPKNSGNPNGGAGRIALAVPPADTGNAAGAAVYSGWLYAAEADASGKFIGLFMTKDFGQNWVDVRIPSVAPNGAATVQAIPTNDISQPNYPITGGAGFLGAQGTYDLTLNVDPANPNVVYVGGTQDGGQTGLIRIDTTTIWDAHANVPYTNVGPGGNLNLNSTGAATVDDKTKLYFTLATTGDTTSYLNFIRNPNQPFLASPTLETYNVNAFTASGFGVKWIPFDVGGTDYHAVAGMIDPLTGLPRLIFGNDQGIWSVLDNNGTFQTQIGSNDTLAGINRNGNIQITQFYYGAAQPSLQAAIKADAMYYGSAQDNGGPVSAPNVLTSGNITWGGPGGDATGVATNQQGDGSAYQFFWPCCGGNSTDFFQYIPVGQSGSGAYIGRTYGLFAQSGSFPSPDPAQWPYEGGANFAVNPVNGADVMISSNTGAIYTTTNSGVTWFNVGAASIFNSPGGFSDALAYGAPDPSAPSGVGNLNNFLYVGTDKGQIYVSQDGGGANGNTWINISTGLDGSTVKQIITDPVRGSHDAYAVTSGGVFYMANSIASATNPTPTWVNITSNLKNLAYSIYGQSYNPTTDPNSVKYNQAINLNTIAADWQYAIPNSPTNPSAGYHPALFVGADSGVYESVDNGQTWSLFPQSTLGAAQSNGNLPHVVVNSLSLSLGNVDPSTGMPTLAGPYQVVSFNGTITNGSATITNASNLNGLAAGDVVTVPGVTGGFTIAAINTSNNSLTLTSAINFTGTSPESVALQASNPTAAADPNTLMAATYGRGEYAINLAPIVLPSSVAFLSTNSTTTDSAGYTVVNTSKPTLNGLSSITAYGNTTWVTIKDLTPGDATYGQVIGGFDPSQPLQANSGNTTNSLGNFTIPVTSALNSNTISLSGSLTAGSATITGLSTVIGLVAGMPIAGPGIQAGTTIQSISGTTLTLSRNALVGGTGVSLLANLKTIEVYTTNDAGAQSNPVMLTFDLQATDLPPVAPTAPPPAPTLQIDLPGPAQTGIPVTNLTAPLFTGTTIPGTSVTVTEVWTNPPTGVTPSPIVLHPTVNAGGSYSFTFQDFQNPAGVNVTLGTFQVYATATYTYDPNNAGPSPQSNTVTFQINDVPPPSVSDLRLSPATDTGIVGDNVTSDRTPVFVGTTEPGSTVNFYLGTTFSGTVVDGSADVAVSSTTGLRPGETVAGTGIVPGTTIIQINPASGATPAQVVLSQAATASSTGNEVLGAGSQESSVTAGISFNGTTTVGSATVLVASTTGLAVGEGIVGPGIAGGSKITNITNLASGESLLTLSLAATAGQAQGLTASGAAFTGNLSLGSAIVSNVSSATGLSVGEVVIGSGIPAGATITAINTTNPANITVTLSAASTTNTTGASLTPTVPGIAGTLTPGSATVLVGGTAGLSVGQTVSGVGIPSGTTIASIDTTDSLITLSQVATGGSSSSLTATGPIFTGTLTNASPIVAVSSSAGLAVGQFVFGVGLPATGAVIQSVNSATQITLSTSATTTATLETLYAASAASDGASYDFSTQLPFSLSNGQTSVFVVVQNAAGNLSAASNPTTVQIVSNPADYNGGPASDPASFTRNTTTNQVQWTVQTPTGTPAPWFGPSGVAYTPSTTVPANQVVPFQGDFDGTGLTGFAYYNIATATWTVLNASTAAISGPSTFVQGTPNQSLPVVGHFDPNGPAEMAVFTVNPSTGQGTWTIASNITGSRSFSFGQSGDIPIAGDFLGLGYDQAAVYRSSTHQFLVYNPQSPSSPTVFTIPASTPDLSSLVPVPGQYDNQAYYNAATHGTNQPIFGQTEAAVYDPITGNYTILGPGGTAYMITGFPTNGIPAPADYLGIGSDQPAVLNPTTGELVIYNPGTGNAPSALRGQLVNFATLPAGSIAVTAPLTYRLPGASLALGTGGTGGSGGLTTGGGTGTGSTGGTTGGTGTGSTGGGGSVGTGTGTGGSGGSLTTPPGGGGSSSGLGTTGTPGGGSSAPGGSSAGTPSQSGGTSTGTGGGPLGIGVVGKHHRHHLVKKKAHPTRHVVKKGHHHIAAKPAHGHHHVIQVIPADHHAAPAFVIGGHLAHKQNAVDLAIEAVHVNLHHNRKPGHSA